METEANSLPGEEIVITDMRTAVRRRPGMYVGSNTGKGIADMICGMLRQCITLAGHNAIFFRITIAKNNTISISADVPLPLEEAAGKWHDSGHYLAVLPHVSARVEMCSGRQCTLYIDGEKQAGVEIASRLAAGSGSSIAFKPDATVFTGTRIDYHYLDESVFHVAAFNPGIKILLRDTTQQYMSQNFHYVPRGIFYVFDRWTDEVVGGMLLKMEVEADIEGTTYRIALGYQNSWDPEPKMLCYENDRGADSDDAARAILDGISAAFRQLLQQEGNPDLVYRKGKMLNGLMLMCATRTTGDKPNESNRAEKTLARIVRERFAALLQGDEAVKAKLLSKFNTVILGVKVG